MKNMWAAVIGIVILVLGLFFVKISLDTSSSFLVALPYVCIGIGCGIFGHGMGGVIAAKSMKNHADVQKQITIEKNDERNMAIANAAKAKAFHCMTYAFGAVILTFALMGVDLIPLLLLVFAYLFVHGCGIYYRWKYEREM